MEKLSISWDDFWKMSFKSLVVHTASVMAGSAAPRVRFLLESNVGVPVLSGGSYDGVHGWWGVKSNSLIQSQHDQNDNSVIYPT